MVDKVAKFIDFDLENQELQIKTDSTEENRAIHVNLYDSSNDAVIQGEITIVFGGTVKLRIRYCVEDTEWVYFGKSPTTDADRTWRITEKSDHSELLIYCNDELVLSYVYASRNSDSVCSAFAVADISRFQFNAGDSASVSYRVVGM